MTHIKRTFTTDQFTYTYIAEPEHNGMRLDQFVKLFLGKTSREFIKKKIEKGEITIQGRTPPHRPSTKVITRDVVTMITLRPDGGRDPYVEHWNHQELDISAEQPELIYEDDNLLVIMKPPYMATHPTGRHFFNCATVYYETKLGHPVHSIHRLDRETSGILLIGKNPKASHEFSGLFETRLIHKCYFLISIVSDPSTLPTFPFTAKERIGDPDTEDESESRIRMEHFPFNSDKGKDAQTEFHLLHHDHDKNKANSRYLLALAFPKTGRQHQIRVHATAHGFPLLGDKIYLGDIELFKRYKDNIATSEDYALIEIPRHALHALALHMPKWEENPIYSEKNFISPLPHDLREWIKLKMPEIDVKKLEEEMKEKVLEYFSSKITS